MVDVNCGKCNGLVLSIFATCSGLCGRCFHHHCVGLSKEELNFINNNNTSVHWYCPDCEPVLTMRHISNTLVEHTKILSDIMSKINIPAYESNLRQNSTHHATTTNTSQPARTDSAIESTSTRAKAAKKTNKSSRAETPTSTAHTASARSRSIAQPNPFEISLSEASSPMFQPVVALHRIDAQNNTNIPVLDQQCRTVPAQDTSKGAIPKRNQKTIGRIHDLLAAQKKLPPLFGTCNENSFIRSSRCLFITKLDPRCTTNDILRHFTSEISASNDDIKIYNISKPEAIYSAFKIWCPNDVFNRAMNPAKWPSGTIIREWINMSKNWLSQKGPSIT